MSTRAPECLLVWAGRRPTRVSEVRGTLGTYFIGRRGDGWFGPGREIIHPPSDGEGSGAAARERGPAGRLIRRQPRFMYEVSQVLIRENRFRGLVALRLKSCRAATLCRGDEVRWFCHTTCPEQAGLSVSSTVLNAPWVGVKVKQRRRKIRVRW